MYCYKCLEKNQNNILFYITSLSRICSQSLHMNILCSHLAFSTVACDLLLGREIYLGSMTIILKTRNRIENIRDYALNKK